MTDESRPLRAALWMIGGIFAFSSMAIAGRALTGTLDTFEMMMYRSFLGLAIMLSVGVATGRMGQVRTQRIGLHIGRNIAHFTGQNLWFFALGLIPLAQLFALEFTSPIWVLLLAVVLLGEKLTRVRGAAVAIGFAGALLVAQPGGGGDPLGLTTAALAAIAFAVSIVTTRALTRTDAVFTILFWLTVTQAVMGVVCAGWDGDIARPVGTDWAWVALIGCAGLFAHLCLTNALSLAPATVVVPMDFLRLPAIAVVGALFYAEPLSLSVLGGALLIFGGNYLNIWSEARSKTAGA